ncbi:NAD(P)H-binding protein [Cellulomonas endometrii]|uniref:NAD(P)H-binding protein n=1 Tax=Cellulomonas endometrii TaxID=3036301 RepID=UPI0024AE5F16|nr:NAD(P)H-binding protein [Cellulomonas endometrii]
MRVVVSTPSGRVGSRVATLLVQAGERPVLLARDPGRLDPALREAADVVPVDLTDADAVVAATAGADAIHWVSPSVPADDPVEAYAGLGAVVARAVRENGIGRVVHQSSVGAEARHGVGEIDGLGRVEELLDATGASVTHLRCGYFFTNLLFDVAGLLRGTLTTTFPLDRRLAWVDPRDVGDVAAARLLSTAWSGRHTQGVHGPEDLSFAEAASVLADALGRPVRAVRITDAEAAAPLRELGLTDAQVDGMVGMLRGLRDLTPQDGRSVRTTTPTTLAAWARTVLRPAVDAAPG